MHIQEDRSIWNQAGRMGTAPPNHSLEPTWLFRAVGKADMACHRIGERVRLACVARRLSSDR